MFGVDGLRLSQQVHGRGQSGKECMDAVTGATTAQSPQQCRKFWTYQLHRQCRLPRQARRRALRRLRGSNKSCDGASALLPAPGMHAPFLMPHPVAFAHDAGSGPSGPSGNGALRGDSYELLGGKTFGLMGQKPWCQRWCQRLWCPSRPPPKRQRAPVVSKLRVGRFLSVLVCRVGADRR